MSRGYLGWTKRVFVRLLRLALGPPLRQQSDNPQLPARPVLGVMLRPGRRSPADRQKTANLPFKPSAASTAADILWSCIVRSPDLLGREPAAELFDDGLHIARQIREQWNRRLKLSTRSVLDHYLNGEAVIHLHVRFSAYRWERSAEREPALRSSHGDAPERRRKRGAYACRYGQVRVHQPQRVFCRDVGVVGLQLPDEFGGVGPHPLYFSLKSGYGFASGRVDKDRELGARGSFFLSVRHDQSPHDVVQARTQMMCPSPIKTANRGAMSGPTTWST